MNVRIRAIILAGGVAALAGAARAQTGVGSVTVLPGQTVSQAITLQAIKAHCAELIARGPGSAGPSAADAADIPHITQGVIVSSVLEVGRAGSFPVLKFAYTAGRSGLVAAVFTFSSPSGLQTFNAEYDQVGYSTRGDVAFSYPRTVPAFSEPGVWTLTSATIGNYAGTTTQYSQTQLHALFQPASLKVLNAGPIDMSPPTVISGKILTPVVSVSSPLPEFGAQFQVKDDVSGVGQVYLAIQPPRSTNSQVGFSALNYPVRDGSATAYSPVYASQPRGKWTITGFTVCDIANNCLNDSSTADVDRLFGSHSFTVTR